MQTESDTETDDYNLLAQSFTLFIEPQVFRLRDIITHGNGCCDGISPNFPLKATIKYYYYYQIKSRDFLCHDSAAFGTTVSSCEFDLGISPKITNFGVPLGIVLYKPTTAISFIIYALYFTKQYNINISAAWTISSVIVVTILAIALPPIPGGALACYTILFMQLGIPAEALEIVMILDIFSDFTSTGFDTALRQCELVLSADRIHMLNKSKLQKKQTRKS